MTAEALLDQLDKVKQTGPGKWQACCPAHDDKSPSLSIRENDEGVVLVKCWSGCTAADIVSAVGLPLTALFPPRRAEYGEPKRRRRERFLPMDALRGVVVEVTLAMLAADDIANGVALSREDRDRLGIAARRCLEALQAVARE